MRFNFRSADDIFREFFGMSGFGGMDDGFAGFGMGGPFGGGGGPFGGIPMGGMPMGGMPRGPRKPPAVHTETLCSLEVRARGDIWCNEQLLTRMTCHDTHRAPGRPDPLLVS